jgi:hypothetical protein
MLEESKFILKHKDYNPSRAVYGFLGKTFPTKSHKYRNDADADGNKDAVLKAFGKNYHSISVLHQVHGKKSIIIDKDMVVDGIEADAHVTTDPSVLLGIQTADCVPLLFIDNENKVVGAAHAGWKGAVGGIIESTMKTMEYSGAKVSNVDVVMGPCIRQNSYEVAKEFYDIFLAESKGNDVFFRPSKHKYFFDLPGYVKNRVQKYPINKFYDIESDTFKNSKSFFSYRRSFKSDKKLQGHILSVVGIK